MPFHNLRIAPLTGRVTFDILDVDLSIVNGLRRVLLADIPTVGFLGEGEPTIEIHKNTGPLHNELIIHRIGMIPLHFSEEETEAFQEGLYEFTLSVDNDKDVMINVTTHDFHGTRDGVKLTEKELGKIFPKNLVSGNPILITRLRQGEGIELTARPIRSSARHHASFSPISMCAFRFLQDPNETVTVNGILEKERAYIRNAYNDPTAIEFSFEIENGAAMKENDAARYLISKAFDVLVEKLNRTIAHEAEYVVCKEIENGFEFTFENEDDTLGNLLQSMMHNRHIRERQLYQDTGIAYVGYVCPHPLDPTMVFKIMFDKGSSKKDESFAWSLLMDNCSWIRSVIEGITNEWLEFVQKNSILEKARDKQDDKKEVKQKVSRKTATTKR